MQFSHLHNHTQFSLLDGASSIKKLYKKAVADRMPAMAITDHGNMFGVYDFVKEAKNYKDENGNLLVKPIVGCEFYIVTDRSVQQFTKDKKDVRYHQLLLAKNKEGYKNLIKLCSLGYTEGLYGKYPRIDKELVLQYHEGLIATTCCLGASVPRTILKDGEDAGEKEFKWWLDIFGEDYYVELQRHDIPDQIKVNEILVKWARKYQVKIIASNDSHYVDEADSNAHDILLCVNTGEKQATEKMKDFVDGDEVSDRKKRFAFYNNQFFFKTTAQMTDLFADLPEAIDNTNEIVSKIDLISVTNDLLLPNFPLPEPFKSQDDYLEFLVFEGAKIKYKIFTPELEERIKFELGVIKKMGFAGYFLIVSDIITSTKKMGVIVGPGRGSAAGSVVAYCIDIISIDPLKYNLLFERFLNPERASMPDIDTDFDDIGRGKVVEYIVNKYGKNQVAHIITHGTMAAKSSIKDVARVMDLPLDESNMLAKLVPDRPGTSLNEMLHIPIKDLSKKEGISAEDVVNVEKLQKIYQSENLQSSILHEAEKLEGTVRNTGIHAAGIIIGPKDLMEIMPLCKQKDIDLYVTQFVGTAVEDAGAIKIDVLGLSNLSIIRDSLIFIKENHGIDLEIEKISLDDEKTFQLYQNADTEGTFQFASAGMKKYLKELSPDNLEDLIAMNALYRPGPLAYIPDFIERKHGRKEIVYDLPEMAEVLKETYGITVYQEQVMLLSQKLANFSKGDADILRKAMGKKSLDVLQKMKAKFIEGCTVNKHPLDKCEKIWNDWVEFAKYAFNKSHSTCYAYLAYQTAYLKANYPSEYMAALLNAQGNTEDISKYMQECKRMGIKVQGPDVNESKKGFSVNKEGTIRFGLGAVKGIGDAAVLEIIKERTENGLYSDIFDLVKRLSARAVSKKTLESMVMAGALDSFTAMHRAQYFHIGHGESASNLEKIVKYGQMLSNHGNTLTHSLFGESDLPAIVQPKMFPCEPWGLSEILEKEKELVGIYISAHPLDGFQFEMNNYHFTPLSSLEPDKLKNRVIRLAGYVDKPLHLVSKKGTSYGKFTLIDYHGEYEFALFKEDYLRFRDFMVKDSKIMISGMFQSRWNSETDFEFKIQRILLLENVKASLTKRINMELTLKRLDDEFVNIISKYAEKAGNCELGIQIVDEVSRDRVKLYNSYKKMEMSDGFIEELSKLEGVVYHVLSS
ncbi:MAG: DNA polymerase III subunit alpha [Bacteroidetes bacterium]|nr:DNA polymerase III subunit alpha [Bacteroidota bacterium]MBP6314273.1 DNA polymerase III subunit alpha [Chitinophagaceae bacterium]